MRAPVVEITIEAGDWPPEDELQALAEKALGAAEIAPAAEVSILFTDDAAIRKLNARYRGQDKPTNVLSFPQTPSHPSPSPQTPIPHLLGDIILAYETVAREAALAGKPLQAHMAHLIIHGFLHLLGYDHESDEDAETMEALERAALGRMGIADPYADARTT